MRPIVAMAVNLALYEHLTHPVIAAAIDVHKATGAGLLEKAYVPCLTYEFGLRHLRFKAQQPISFTYKGVPINTGCTPDFVVEDVLVVELKSVPEILPIHEAQILTYMRLANCPVGLLINFNVPKLVDGVKRKVNPRATVAAPITAGAPETSDERIFEKY